MVTLADEMQAVHLVRTLAVLQDREKILRIGCVGTEPIKRRDALVPCSDVSLALGMVLVRLRDRAAQPLSAGQIRPYRAGYTFRTIERGKRGKS